jgi:methionyl-tRNA formyltransferase
MIDERGDQKGARRNGGYGERVFDQSQPSSAGSQPKHYRHKAPIVFFGSGPVAAASLAFLAEHFEVEAVITKPQPAHHKEPFPVLTLAEELGLKTYTPVGKQELSELFATRPVTSKLGVVIDYGFIINQDVIDYFPLGIVNSHFSLLPEWRGADPITFAILSGQKQTGVSLMLIDEKMDEGPLLAQATYDIYDEETTPSLTRNLIELSNQTLLEILPLYLDGKAQPAPQLDASILDDKTPTYSRKLAKEDGMLDFNKPALQLEREIRAYAEWPKSHTQLGKIDVIITQAHAVPSTMPEPAGHIEVMTDPGILMINTVDGYLCIDRLKPVGKKEMNSLEFLNGYGKQLSRKD